MTNDCERALEEAAYYMDSDPLPAVGISHWRDDPIVAWLDEFCQEQFESGASFRAPILLCFRPHDSEFFAKVLAQLPAMVRIAAGLSEWVRFAQELENASECGDRNPEGIQA
jgi:hypothetical protein